MDNENKLSRRRFLQLASSIGAGTFLGCGNSLTKPTPGQNPLQVSGSKIRFPLGLNKNENPYGPFSKALEAIRKSAEIANYYTGDSKSALRKALVEKYRLDAGQVLLGCGSIELLKIIAEIFCSPALPPVIPEPVYEAINYYGSLQKIQPIKVPLTPDFKHDLDRMAEVCRENDSMVYICNPSNPTGTILHKDEINRFLDRVPWSTVVVVDEAYAEYTDSSDFESCAGYVEQGRPNVIVLRTFSKFYGLAGLRVGYALGPHYLIQAMASHRLWNNINQAGAAAALASLTDQQAMAAVHRQNARVRRDFYKEADILGLEYIPSETSFVMLNVKRAATDMIPAFKDHQILVGRLFPSLPEYLRISLGTREEMSFFFKILKKLIA